MFYNTLKEIIWKGMKKDRCYKEILVYNVLVEADSRI